MFLAKTFPALQGVLNSSVHVCPPCANRRMILKINTLPYVLSRPKSVEKTSAMRTVRHGCALAVVNLQGMSKRQDQSEDSGPARAACVPVPQTAPSTSSGGELLTVKAAARRLGVKPTTLYDWLGQSDWGQFVIRGQATTIRYFQGGPRGCGRIWLEVEEIERLRELMRVRPHRIRARRPPRKNRQFPGITVPLGRPNGPA
jgi:transposase-like protein